MDQQIAKLPLGRITKKLMSDYMNARKKEDKVSNSTVNREATVVNTMLNKAVEWDVIERNPLEKFRLLPEAPKRNVDLTPDEAAILLKELTESFANIVEFAIYSGFRLENILSLTVEQIRFNNVNGTGDVRLKVKGGKWGSYPIGKNAVDVMKRAIENRTEGFIFINKRTGTRYYSVSKSFRRVVRKLGIYVGDSPLTFHDLRHVHATWLHKKGVSLDILRVLLGHSNRSTTDRYTTAYTSDAAKVLSLMPKIKSLNYLHTEAS